jgi:hypothetical protein
MTPATQRGRLRVPVQVFGSSQATPFPPEREGRSVLTYERMSRTEKASSRGPVPTSSSARAVR